MAEARDRLKDGRSISEGTLVFTEELQDLRSRREVVDFVTRSRIPLTDSATRARKTSFWGVGRQRWEEVKKISPPAS
jgi:hypothetical protein